MIEVFSIQKNQLMTFLLLVLETFHSRFLGFVAKQSCGVQNFRNHIPLVIQWYYRVDPVGEDKNVLTFVFTDPDTLYISPKNADRRELFPDPTEPTTATRLPELIFTLISCKIREPSGPFHEKAPFSIESGAPESVEFNEKL